MINAVNIFCRIITHSKTTFTCCKIIGDDKLVVATSSKTLLLYNLENQNSFI
jgi:hypothetical protein